MRRIIVTGATSYIAIALIKRLLAEGYLIYAVIRPGSANRVKLPQSARLHILELNMDQYFALSTMELGEIDAVYHFAWDAVRGQSRTDDALQLNNIECAKQLLEVVCQCKIPCFIGMGSQAEYGLTGGRLITEDTPLNPVESYGMAKKSIFLHGMEQAGRYELNFVWARIFSAYGYGESPNTLIMSSLAKMLRGEDIKLSPCEHLWDYLYLEDLAEALYLLYEAHCPTGAYNISYGCPRPLKYYLEKMKEIFHSHSRLEFGAIPYGPNIVQMNPSIGKIQSAALWSPKIDFETGIQKLYEDVKNGYEKDKHISTDL